MLDGNLDTTNLLLGIMAAVSVLEARMLLAAGVMAWKLYRQTMQTVREIEGRQIAPLREKVDVLMGRVDGILGDVKTITSRVGEQTERVNSAISTTIDRAMKSPYKPAVSHRSWKVNRPTLTTLTTIHTIQFSTYLRASSHCATRLTAVGKASHQGTSVSVAWVSSRAVAGQSRAATASAVSRPRVSR